MTPIKRPIQRWEWILLLIATAIGAMLRFWMVPRVPGLWYDEAINGLDALQILNEPGFPIFFATENHMREPLYMYLEALGVLTGGTTAIALRAVSAVIGAITIPVVWLLAREFRGAHIAALAVVFFALMRWHIHFSALAFRTILAPLFCALVFLFFFRMLRKRGYADSALCGVFLGLGAYTYLAFRLVPVMLLLAGGWFIASEYIRIGPRALKLRLKQLGAAVAAAFLVFLPLGLDYLENPDHFTGRSGEVSLFERENTARIIARQARDVALMPLLRGDHVGKHNLPGPPRFNQIFEENPEDVLERWNLEKAVANAAGRPPYDPHGTGVPIFGAVGGLLFYLGFFLLLFRRTARNMKGLALCSWILIGSLASLLSFGAPNILRLLILTPAAAIALSLGAELVMRRLLIHRWQYLLLGGALILLFAGTEISRLIRWPHHPMVTTEFNAEWADVGDYLRKQPDRLPVRLPFDAPATLRFLAHGHDFNPPARELQERWWEFRTEPPFPTLEPWGLAMPDGRSTRIFHPANIMMGRLVETVPPPGGDPGPLPEELKSTRSGQ